MEKIAVFWFRRDLRLNDNVGLHAALASGLPVLPFFIFDTEILDKLQSKQDARVLFIHRELAALKKTLEAYGSSLLVFHGKLADAFDFLTQNYTVNAVFTNRDYEPYALERDALVQSFLAKKGIQFQTFKDHVIFEKGEVLKDDGSPYTVFTPYSKKWKDLLTDQHLKMSPSETMLPALLKCGPLHFPSLHELGFVDFEFDFPLKQVSSNLIVNYGEFRDFPAVNGTSRLGIHLRFGTISIRELTKRAMEHSEVYLNELIWRNFFIDLMAHFPYTAGAPFKKQYAFIPWRNNEVEFAKWCRGETGYPMVDAGMRELNDTGFMHNRVRMVTASFLTKHLLIDWRWGETYFAEKLLDFELASNNGNWQWAAGTGADAAPYFRVFNPEIQRQKFDADGKYILKWVPEAGTIAYAKPIIEHAFARQRVIETYKKALTAI